MPKKILSLCLALVAASLLLAACGAPEDTRTTEHPEEEVSFLFVQNATSGTLTPVAGAEDVFLLTLEGVSYSTLWFSDRPALIAGHELTRLFIANWGTGQEDSFAASPPNAALDILEGEAEGDVLVVQLSQPEYDEAAARLTYQAKVLRDVTGVLEVYNLRIDDPEAIPRSFGHAALFIDSSHWGPDWPVSVMMKVFQGTILPYSDIPASPP